MLLDLKIKCFHHTDIPHWRNPPTAATQSHRFSSSHHLWNLPWALHPHLLEIRPGHMGAMCLVDLHLATGPPSRARRRTLLWHLQFLATGSQDPTTKWHPVSTEREEGGVSCGQNNLTAEILFLSSERECDLDKHCGVLDPERKKICTRLLTCNVSSQHS